MNSSLIEKSVISKVKWRLVSFCILLYIVNILDRGSLSYAALDMNKALGIDPATFGLLTSIFFVGYFFFEVPSNMLLHRFGANKWMARIMVSWGLVTCGMFFVQNFTHISILRFLLGVCEAGFYPGMVYFFTLWFPQRYRGGVMALFVLAQPITGAIGAPLATIIMDNISWLGHDGWRWVFMLEGFLAVILGIWCFFGLTNNPKEAKWLTQEEQDWLVNGIAAEDALKTETAHFSISKVFKYGKVWHFALIYMFIQSMVQTVTFWMPTFVKEFSTTYSNTKVGYIMMLPALLGLIAMIYWGHHSDKTGERVYHTAAAMAISAIGLGMIVLSPSVNIKIVGLIINAMGYYSIYGPFWSMPTNYLTGEAAAIGVAIINSMSSFGGFSANLIVGQIKGSSFGTGGVLIFQILATLIAIVLTIILRTKNISSPRRDA